VDDYKLENTDAPSKGRTFYSKELSNTMETYPYLEASSGLYPQHFLQLSWTLEVYNKISQDHITKTIY